jgi:nicotinic acid mononucleotide adenylyltransferase
MSAADPDADSDPFSLQRLFDRCHHFIQTNQNNNNNNNTRCLLSVAVAGGGSTFLSALASTAGASTLLMQGITTYDRASFRHFTGVTPRRYASPESAVPLAHAALRQALVLAATSSSSSSSSSTRNGSTSSGRNTTMTVLNKMALTVGLGCASALQSDGNSRAYIAVSLQDGMSVQYAVTLSPRSRREQDVAVSHFMLSCLEQAMVLLYDNRIDDISPTNDDKDMTQGTNSPAQKNQWLVSRGGTSRLSSAVLATTTRALLVDHDKKAFFFFDKNDSNNNDDETDDTTDAVMHWTEETTMGDTIQVCIRPAAVTSITHEAAELVLSGRQASVLLIPNQRTTSYTRLATTVLPPNCIIFPGSYNPPHMGHLELVQAAAAAAQRDHATTVWFELSLTNVDKRPLVASVVVKRLDQLWRFANDNGLSTKIPWGVVLTNAPLFVQKVKLLQPRIQQIDVSQEHTPSNKSNGGNDDNTDDDADPAMSFLIGADTLVRLLNPVYYHNSRDEMLQALTTSMKQCYFFVGGRRLDHDALFVTGHEYIQALPPSLARKFTILHEFRVDVSSTAIRLGLQSASPPPTR